MVKIFNQKCVIGFGSPKVFAFRQCGHQRIFEEMHQKKEI